MTHDKLSPKTIEKIIKMAKLYTDEKGLDKYADMAHILKFIGQIDQIDTTDVPPMEHPFSASQRLREDTVTEINQRDLYQSIALDRVDAGVYLVPQVIEGEK